MAFLACREVKRQLKIGKKYVEHDLKLDVKRFSLIIQTYLLAKLPTINCMTEIARRLQYSIEKWTIYPDQNLIDSGSDQIYVEPKTMSVLVFLIEKQGQTISREEFINEVWGGTVVTDNSLNQSISKLRKIFNDETAKPRIIETVSKRGYRLIAPVQMIDEEQVSKKKYGDFKFSLRNTVVILFSALTLAGIFWIYTKLVPGKKEYPSSIFSAIDGMERHPAFTKNADRVAYVFGNVCNDESEIRIQRIGSDETYSLARIPGFKKFPRFSGDDHELIFWNENGRPIVSTLYHAAPPDTSLIKWLEIPASVRGLDWTNDKKFITYSARSDDADQFCVFLFDREKNQVIQITKPIQSTTNDLYPVFSPDGKSIAFARGNSEFDFDLWTIEIETKNLKRLTFDNLTIRGLAWPVDGIFYSRLTEEDLFQLVRLGENSSEVISTSSDQYSAFDARNNKLIYQVNTAGISITGYDIPTHRRRILFNSNFQETNPEFSPSGKSFAFISNRTGPFQLWIGDITGTQIKKVSKTKLSNLSNQPRWSLDESSLLIDVIENGKSNVYQVNLKDGSTNLFINDASHPVFSNDGQFLYFNSRRTGSSQIWKIPVDGGKTDQITFKGGFVGFESPIDSSFYFMKETEDGIWRKKGSSEEMIFRGVTASEARNWRLFKNKIYFAKRFNEVWCYDILSKSSSKILTIDAGTCGLINGISISPDGKSILFSHDERIESDLRILEY